MTDKPDNYEIKGLDACHWVIFWKNSNTQVPKIRFGSKIEAELALEREIQYWNKKQEYHVC